jgi:hypothetical protein
MRLTRLSLTAVAGLALFCSACSSQGKTVKVRGKVIDPNKDLSFDPLTGRLAVAFHPWTDGPSGPEGAFDAIVSPDGAFTVTLPPGKYRISVAHYVRTDFSPMGQVKNETYKGQFSAERSLIVRDILESTDDLTIDLSRPEG